jgi:hypothetical protein
LEELLGVLDRVLSVVAEDEIVSQHTEAVRDARRELRSIAVDTSHSRDSRATAMDLLLELPETLLYGDRPPLFG